MFAKSMTLTKTDIDRAFAQDEFAIVLQPQIDMVDGCVVAAEAFVRWNHPSFGTMTPQLFLASLEACGQTPQLLDVVVTRALEAADAFQKSGRDWRVSVNLGVSDLTTGIAPEIVEAALRRTGVPAEMLMLEAPEAALCEDDETVRMALEQLRELGCGTALDSGASLPLAESEAVPHLFNEVKIGGAAIMRFAEIARKVDGGRIARRMAFARRHQLRSVAVGVESEKTLTALMKLGFGSVQGALVAKPAPLDELLDWDGGWAGETSTPQAETAPMMPALRPRPRLVVPAPVVVPITPVVAEPAATPKLVERLMPSAEDEEDPFDVDFDDETSEAVEAAPEAELAEFDPADDIVMDGEEIDALENSAPLHAGLIERPRKRGAEPMPYTYAAEGLEIPSPTYEDEQPEPVFDRTFTLQMKAPPPPKTFLQRLGFGRARQA